MFVLCMQCFFFGGGGRWAWGSPLRPRKAPRLARVDSKPTQVRTPSWKKPQGENCSICQLLLLDVHVFKLNLGKKLPYSQGK